MRREATVKGVFYPSSADKLKAFFDGFEYSPNEKKNVKAVIVPHAGYIYSGKTAMNTLSCINIPDTVIMLGPNHTGLGSNVAVYPKGDWETPLGDVPIAGDIVMELMESHIFQRDTLAHIKEHSLEVIVPMLKYLNPNVSVVPITIKHMGYDSCEETARMLYKVVGDRDDVLVLVSSDFNHYENSEITEKKDLLAINKILEMDAEGLVHVVSDENISMCGVIPSAVAVIFGKLCSKSSARLVEHTHSGYVSGDFDRCVGYAGIIIE